jgi:putative component of membrane protein insertase Oxa1/YidC/SpoIIIJ protein YidD
MRTGPLLLLLVVLVAALPGAAVADMRAPDDPLARSRDQLTARRVEEQASSSGASAGKLLIYAYQNLIGPAKGSRCPMFPSCSNYAQQAIARYGLLRGMLAAGDRLHRCGHDLRYYPPLRTTLGMYFEDLP